ncbi:hypothetical protein TVAG_041680 [Trichomonas vaginalis G3]|uniref:Uncharacterized protein n=1 Tax=Trichomonas vaginalis (strain ATCC PRA-98 / G3) TaxID=412133 RepID=A2FEW2_TRIV3|nr:hypothetical protein TVAGG3_0702800 [Trichomonas vaginalis G3]EAX96566.1 hypothetical protein TVAG_041680 [Trichomonas vaginalis G3]KAI5509351.1 hypothetical protein TVAGG3_0702800 [Trichomonas vaginalis G3]|eukprot:XP_001309496.1 hypothetical protein [Trichomonas vaginalis G3]
MEFRGYGIYVLHDFLYYNKFAKLDDDDIKTLGSLLIKMIINQINVADDVLPKDTFNAFGFLFGGILHRYAKLEGADKAIIKDIEAFAKCFRLRDEILVYHPITGEPFFYSDGHHLCFVKEKTLPPLTIVENDPVFD